MKHRILLTIASLLAMLCFTMHLADDITRGIEKGGVWNLSALLILAFWLYGTLVLAERRSGYILVILGSLIGLLIPLAHMTGKGVGAIAKTGGGFFFVLTILVLGAAALFSVILSAGGLWSLRSGPRGS